MAPKAKRGRSMRDRVKNRANRQRGSQFGYITIPDGIEMMKIDKEGNYRFDVIPYEIKGPGNPEFDENDEDALQVGDLYFERTFYAHKKVGPERKDTVLCLQKNNGKPCPVCELIKELNEEKTGKEKDEEADAAIDELVKEILPKERQLWLINDYTEGTVKEPKLKLFDMSYHLFGKVLDKKIKAMDDDEDFDCFPDLQGGYTVKAYFEKKAFGTITYYECSSLDFKPRRGDYDDSILDDAPDLDAVLKFKTYSDIKAMVEGVGEESEEEVETEEKKEEALAKEAPKKSRKSRKPAPAKQQEEAPIPEGSHDAEDLRQKEFVKEETGEEDSEESAKGADDDDEGGECPEGHEFGVDCDEKDACDDCPIPIWTVCEKKRKALDSK